MHPWIHRSAAGAAGRDAAGTTASATAFAATVCTYYVITGHVHDKIHRVAAEAAAPAAAPAAGLAAAPAADPWIHGSISFIMNHIVVLIYEMKNKPLIALALESVGFRADNEHLPAYVGFSPPSLLESQHGSDKDDVPNCSSNVKWKNGGATVLFADKPHELDKFYMKYSGFCRNQRIIFSDHQPENARRVHLCTMSFLVHWSI